MQIPRKRLKEETNVRMVDDFGHPAAVELSDG
jgi:hypothetical protein